MSRTGKESPGFSRGEERQRQLTRTALQLVSEHLVDLLDPAYETADWIDKKLCEGCPPADCVREDADAEQEIAAVQVRIRQAVEYLQERLAVHASDEGIDLKEAEMDGVA